MKGAVTTTTTSTIRPSGDFLHWLMLWLNTWTSYGYDAGDPPYIKYPLIWITVDGEIFNRKLLPRFHFFYVHCFVAAVAGKLWVKALKQITAPLNDLAKQSN